MVTETLTGRIVGRMEAATSRAVRFGGCEEASTLLFVGIVLVATADVSDTDIDFAGCGTSRRARTSRRDELARSAGQASFSPPNDRSVAISNLDAIEARAIAWFGTSETT
jgi:hypothetical protein